MYINISIFRLYCFFFIFLSFRVGKMRKPTEKLFENQVMSIFQNEIRNYFLHKERTKKVKPNEEEHMKMKNRDKIEYREL